jgi:hypothetical protein
LKLLLGATYGLTVAGIITDIQQNNIGKVFDVSYLIALTSTNLLYQYSESTAAFAVDATDRIFQPSDMTHTNWQTVISLLWVSFKLNEDFQLNAAISQSARLAQQSDLLQVVGINTANAGSTNSSVSLPTYESTVRSGFSWSISFMLSTS